MNLVNCTLLLVTMEEAAEADCTYDMSIGEAMDLRKCFFTTHLKNVRNLDKEQAIHYLFSKTIETIIFPTGKYMKFSSASQTMRNNQFRVPKR